MPETGPDEAPGAARFPATKAALRTATQRGAYDLIEGRRGRVPAPYLPLLGSPRVADLFEQLSTALWTGGLPQGVLEAVFLMAAQRQKCAHQWHTHRDKAAAAGVTETMIDAISRGEVPLDGGSVEAAGRLYVSLVERHGVADDVLLGVQRRFGERGTSELIAFCGVADTIAMLLNVQLSPAHGQSRIA